MKKSLLKYFLVLLLNPITFHAQQLIVNEVSQGPSGAKEYVELVVVGTPSCNGSNSMDLRNYIIDDNNGNFATGGGVGIAMGCVRLKNIAFWSAIPFGTLILIYNDNDLNASVPPADLSMTDGNCKLIIPISNCALLERFTTQPAAGNASYPTSGFTNCGGTWSEVSMANGGDSFQTITPTGGLQHAVSWGNNNVSTIIYFAGSAGGNVIYNDNSANTNPFNQANWVNVPVLGNETPGLANTSANAAWINSMNNNCTLITPFSIATSFTNAACVCNGIATISASGGIAPYTYTWLPNGQNGSSISNLCAGIYTVVALSSNSCLLTNTVAITAAPALTLNLTTNSVSCFGGVNGSASVNAMGGTPPYTYTWTPSSTHSSNISNLAAGIYSVSVNSANNCTAQASATIAQPTAPLLVAASITNIACANISGGAIALNVIGGTANYTYSWSPSVSNNATATNLIAGVYSSTITDANGCQQVTSHSVAPSSGSLIVNVSTTPETCLGLNNGSATLVPIGGTAPFVYNWSPAISNTSTASGLSPGIYSVTVVDVGGCQRSVTLAIAPAIPLTLSVSLTQASCAGAAISTATAQVSGGSGAYTYNWLPSGGTASVSNALAAGAYSITVSDANNCQQTTTLLINAVNVPIVTVNTSSVSCFGFNNGSAAAFVNGGSAPYTYNWSSSATNSTAVNGLTAGTYTLTVTDNANCLVSSTFNIIQPNALLAVISSTNLGCNNSAATASVTASGGVGVYTYSWQPIGATSAFITNLSVGIYTVTVRDANACSTTQSVQITTPNPFTITPLASTTVCSGTPISFSATVSGAAVPLNYLWLPGNTTSATLTITPNASVIYTLTVSDGCVLKTTTLNVLVESKPNLVPLEPKQGCTPLCVSYNGQEVTNPAWIKNWIWKFSTGVTINSSNPSLCFEKAGNYKTDLVLETTANCTYTYLSVATITAYQTPVANFVANQSYTTTEYEANYILTNTSLFTDSLVWYAPQTPQYGNSISLNFSEPGVYPVSMSAFNGFGCSDTIVRYITVKPEFSFYAPNALNMNADAVSKVFIAKGTGWDVSRFQMRIFNRWGQEIYATKDYSAGWNGTLGGTSVKDDTYIWQIEVYDLYSKVHSFTGHLTLIK